MGGPWVHPVAALAAHPGDVITVEDLEREAEARLHLVPPLQQHRRRGRDGDLADLSPKEQLACDEAGLNGVAQPDVIGDEEIDPWQQKGLVQWLELVGVQSDAR